ncbi:hypothetical protein LUZ60_012033 [Juncus effusus]|nr:hypothetical protein LUZ60_012033 [Juncus effusus]
MNGNNLPAPADVVALYKKHNITGIRLYNPVPAVQEALRGQDLLVTLGIKNEDLENLAANQTAAIEWVNTNLLPYANASNYNYLVVGNEVIPGDLGKYVAPAMQNLYKAVDPHTFSFLKITTAVPSNILANSSPPSNANFADAVMNDMKAIIQALNSFREGNNILMFNVYPYFAYAADPTDIPLEFAQFTSTTPPVVDGDLKYFNLFDAMMDSFYSALEKNGGNNLRIVVSESGWPSAGNGNFTTIDLARTYNANFMNHVKNNGTPKRPANTISAFIFAMFNENQKSEGVEQNFGLFYPNMQPVYPIFN